MIKNYLIIYNSKTPFNVKIFNIISRTLVSSKSLMNIVCTIPLSNNYYAVYSSNLKYIKIILSLLKVYQYNIIMISIQILNQ